MFSWPKAQRWDQQGHSAPKERKKKTEQEKKHPTKLVKAATCCLLSRLTTTTGWILRGIIPMKGIINISSQHISLKLENGYQGEFENISKLVSSKWESRNNQNVS